jgi:hypothetical protein
VTPKLYVYKADWETFADGRYWVVDDYNGTFARFISHRTALHYALWKSGLEQNYGYG